MSASPPSQSYQSPMLGHAEDRHTPLSTHRRQASTGGGRAWSEQEESYLIETRLHKMPYKHIAAHLQKTELACRLHYHQLSFGTKRRRRNSSVSSARSNTSSVSSPVQTFTLPQRSLPAISPPASPESLAVTRAHSPYDPVPILPKPSADHRCTIAPHSSLRLITEDIERFEERSRVNKDRLGRIYDAHRSHFWSMIARDYGDNITPATLEEVWRRHNANPISHYPPTPPSRSPDREKPAASVLGPAFIDVKASQAFHAVNMPGSAPCLPTGALPSRGSFAIASLLTEDKDVRRLGGRR